MLFLQIHVLEMPERKAAGIFLKIRKRIVAGNDQPADIHFHFYRLRIGPVQQHIVQNLSVLLFKFFGMVMIPEDDFVFPAIFRSLIKNVCTFLVVLHCLSARGKGRTDQVFLSGLSRLVNRLLPVLIYPHMTASYFHTQVIGYFFDFFWRQSIIITLLASGRLQLFVSHFCQRL